MEPSEEIKKLLQELLDTEKENLAFTKEFAERSFRMQEANERRVKQAMRDQRMMRTFWFLMMILFVFLVTYLNFFSNSNKLLIPGRRSGLPKNPATIATATQFLGQEDDVAGCSGFDAATPGFGAEAGARPVWAQGPSDL